jgi:cytochrome P450
MTEGLLLTIRRELLVAGNETTAKTIGLLALPAVLARRTGGTA